MLGICFGNSTPSPLQNIYVIVISRARGMYGIYYTKARSGECPCIPSARDITSLYPEGAATIDTNLTITNS